MRANHYKRCTEYREVCCRAQHARAVFRLSCVYIPVSDIAVIANMFRCLGHSWSPIFGQNGQILISMLNLPTASKLPNIASLPFPESAPTELESIEITPGK